MKKSAFLFFLSCNSKRLSIAYIQTSTNLLVTFR